MSALGPPRGLRTFADPETGERFRAYLAPREGSPGRGTNPALEALIFETEEGRWVGAVPVYGSLALGTLSEPMLASLLRQARGGPQ